MAKRKRYHHRPHQKRKTIKKAGDVSGVIFGVILLVITTLFVVTNFEQVDIPVIEQVADGLELYDDGKTPAVDTAQEGETQVHFIDVGQGDATLIAQSGEYALIDTGVNAVAEDLVGYLQALGVETISVFVMTHPHADHMGGMDEILEAFTVETVILPDFSLASEFPTSATFSTAIEALENSPNTVVQTAVVGASYAIGQGSLTILSTGVETSDYNDISVCTMFTVGDFKLLNTGDAEDAVEESLLDSGVDLTATVFQAGHHGSSTSNTLAFLQAVQPDYVVISCALDNSYGHPHTETLANIAAVGADYYRTDLNGNIVITYTAADGIAVICEQEAA